MAVLIRPANVFLRTVQAFVPQLARPDDAAARAALTPQEYGIYQQMDRRDRAHSTVVVRRLLQLQPTAPAELVAAAWLHDVGKSLLPFNPVHRVLVHLQPGDPLPAEPLQRGLQGARQLKAHHECIGARLIRQAGGRDEVAELVAALSLPVAGQPPEVAALQRADEET